VKRRSDERGGGTVELVVLTPALIGFVLLVVLGGRLVGVRGDLDGAARQAARSASLAGNPGPAEVLADETARSALTERGLDCRALRVDVDVTRFAPGGTVAVTLTCAVGLSDLGLPGLPGERTLQAHAVAPIDPLAVLR
jgi:Flp pilus assembly protein TadG